MRERSLVGIQWGNSKRGEKSESSKDQIFILEFFIIINRMTFIKDRNRIFYRDRRVADFGRIEEKQNSPN